MTDTSQAREAQWLTRNEPVALDGREELLVALIGELTALHPLTSRGYNATIRAFARRGLPWLSKSQVLDAYERLCAAGRLAFDPDLRTHLQMKPMRTQAGVAVVTVLTKPYPCPGRCVFCPTDARMPKSYLHDEPGAQRAERHAFDPFAQTASRLRALEKIGHPTGKVELLVLGGTWSSYRRDYQEWFIKRCFDALNGFEAATLAEAQAANAVGRRRNVGLVVETRQDHIDADELRWFRALGVTKVQVGIQSLDERVLALNARGHDVAATRDAFRLLRLAGFKIHGHWMANLLGATPEGDAADYARLWDDPAIRPDELKIYPCMLLPNAELHDYWLRGEYTPYTEEELVDLLARCKAQTPPYVRLTRVVRDFPTTNVVAGNKKANLRQLAQERLREAGTPCRCIRCREIRRDPVPADALALRDLPYATDATTEHFLSFETGDERLAAFLRLSLPTSRPLGEVGRGSFLVEAKMEYAPHPFPELAGCAMIREVHVYGPALDPGTDSRGEAQHTGLGAALIEHARAIARAAGYPRLAVISAVGTREYYRRLGFAPDGLYMIMEL
ncbi:MAG: tRNA uridine(34) 5-carboxymethylaminomethyl modification radical SAM/GNAT enzyme Elp3 [Candidatus Promineofilum sp.]|nr:tRNA uridine(34) 5-carboxymethylaminomethyl modification radical SAM/GNAT enzyme Elp3 [Promineifilum sp.]